MGRNRGHRQKLNSEIEGVRQKTMEAGLVILTRERFAVCEPEAQVLVGRMLTYLRPCGPSEPQQRALNQIQVHLPRGCGVRWRNGWDQLPKMPVIVTPVAADDLDVWHCQGIVAMQNARLIRLSEEADRAMATIPMAILSTLVPINRRAVSQRLQPLWKAGFHLPVLGSSLSASGQKSRLAETVRAKLVQISESELEKQLCLSPARHRMLLRDGAAVAAALRAGAEPEAIAMQRGLSPFEVGSVADVLRQEVQDEAGQHRLDSITKTHAPPFASTWTEDHPFDRRGRLEAMLIQDHSFSPMKARLYVDEIESALLNLESQQRDAHQIVFYATAADEPAGKQRRACRLKGVQLAYYEAQDHREAPKSEGLKLAKVIRFATMAKAQGGLLTVPDLAFLVGIAPQSIVRLVADSKVYVPTRGREWDIGPGITHKSRIVTLYVQGYTETEIVRKTNHTYEAIERYIEDFRSVMCLHERGLPEAHVRKATGMSQRLVEAYLELYQELNTDENQWKLNLMRRGFAALEKKKALRRPHETP